MTLARILLILAICVADGIFLLNASAADIVTTVAPPAPRVENMGHPRDGYVWAPGHWEWTGHDYRWVSGGWIVEHGRSHWIADQWEASGAQWRFVPGHWER
jgi:WXXGXW repeat (2 copies)